MVSKGNDTPYNGITALILSAIFSLYRIYDIVRRRNPIELFKGCREVGMIDKTNRISGLGDIHFFIFQKNRGLLQTNVPDKFTRRNTREPAPPASPHSVPDHPDERL